MPYRASPDLRCSWLASLAMSLALLGASSTRAQSDEAKAPEPVVEERLAEEPVEQPVAEPIEQTDDDVGEPAAEEPVTEEVPPPEAADAPAAKQPAAEPIADTTESVADPVVEEPAPSPAHEEASRPSPTSSDDVDVLPAVPPRHTGEILPPPLAAAERWGARATGTMFVDDLLGVGTLWNPTAAGGTLGLDDGAARTAAFGFGGHLVGYGSLPAMIPQLSLEGALVARFVALSAAPSLADLRDDGSYLKASWAPLGRGDGLLDGPVVALTVFPLSSDRLRLGYLQDLSWGGDAILPAPDRMTPAVRVGIEWLGAYAFVAGKAAILLDETPGLPGERPFGSALAGVGVDILDLVALETAGGWFSRGTSPLPGIRGEAVPAFGISSRAALHFGRSEVVTPDARLLRDDLGLVALSTLNAPVSGFNGLLSLEHTWLGSNMIDTDDPQEVETVPAQTLGLSGRLQWEAVSLAVDTYLREAEWRTVQGSPAPFFSRDERETAPELFAGGSASLALPSIASRLSLVATAALPATLTNHDVRLSPSNPASAEELLVFRPGGRLAVLPAGEERGLDLSLGVLAQVALGPMLDVAASVSARADGNVTRIVNTAAGLPRAVRATTAGLPFQLESAAFVMAQLHL